MSVIIFKVRNKYLDMVFWQNIKEKKNPTLQHITHALLKIAEDSHMTLAKAYKQLHQKEMTI